MRVKIIINRLSKLFCRKHSDYNFKIYILRISSFILSWLYYLTHFFSRTKRLFFHENNNILRKKYLKLIDKYNKKLNIEFNNKFIKSGHYDFSGLLLPLVNDVTTLRFIYEDVLSIYAEHNDNYNYKIVDRVEKESTEGPFCYVGPNGEDITIHKGDIVIDAGAWIGDFSAYCAKKEAIVHAFEPTPSTVELLEQTILLNNAEKYIKIAPYGLSDVNEIVKFTNYGSGSANTISASGNVNVELIALDDWVEKNNIDRIDFIKADIEGAERNMLRGATKILKRFAPTLSICTYHLSDDPFVLEKIILEANPAYKIIQRKMKLFAYIDKK